MPDLQVLPPGIQGERRSGRLDLHGQELAIPQVVRSEGREADPEKAQRQGAAGRRDQRQEGERGVDEVAGVGERLK